MIINDDYTAVNPELVKILGFDETVLLGKLNKHVKKNEASGKNFKEGKYWVSRTFEEWVKSDFIYWSADVIKKHFRKLVKMGIVISRPDFNENPEDKTKWFTIDYEAVDKL
ncbi:MAG: hypothetical protein LBV08_04245 [Clostridiales bacterium]|jgi:hypothetical protein|nr:hypothetical protein [Clostridiales bacterium]